MSEQTGIGTLIAGALAQRTLCKRAADREHWDRVARERIAAADVQSAELTTLRSQLAEAREALAAALADGGGCTGSKNMSYDCGSMGPDEYGTWPDTPCLYCATTAALAKLEATA